MKRNAKAPAHKLLNREIYAAGIFVPGVRAAAPRSERERREMDALVAATLSSCFIWWGWFTTTRRDAYRDTLHAIAMASPRLLPRTAIESLDATTFAERARADATTFALSTVHDVVARGWVNEARAADALARECRRYARLSWPALGPVADAIEAG